MRMSGKAALVTALGLLTTNLLGAPPASDAATSTDWSGYEHGPAHSSAAFNDTAITPANVASLHVLWSFTAGPSTLTGAPAPKFDASATVVGGRVYIGSHTGIFYALDASSGGVVQIDQHTGLRTHTYYAVPAGTFGASVWSSLAGNGTSAWVTTGDPNSTATQVYDAYSIVRLSASTLAKQ